MAAHTAQESRLEMLSRVESMARPISTWDLSDNDIAAITEVLTQRAVALAKLREVFSGMACSCRLQPLVGGPVPCPTCQIGAAIARAEGQ
jgi:hypothetical protein